MFNKKEDKNSEGKKQELLTRIRPIIAEQLGVNEAKITAQSKIGDDLGADSLDATELVMALEEEFNIEIFDEDAEKMTTVNDILAYLEKNSPLNNPQKRTPPRHTVTYHTEHHT